MSIEKYLSRVQQADQLIRLKSTGSPRNFGELLNISERQVYNLIDDLRTLGAPIVYDRCRQTYYYTRHVKINATICVEELSEIETLKISGGSIFRENLSKLQFHCTLSA